MMKIIKYFTFVILFMIVQSCVTNELSKEDKEWQPYKKGDILVFKSSENERDTIFVNDVKVVTGPSDPLDVAPTKTQSLYVSGTISLREPRKQGGQLFYRSGVNILRLISSEEGSSFISFVFKTKEAAFYGKSMYSIKELKNAKLLKFGQFEDVILFESNREGYKNRDNYMTNFYWSKNFGYVHYKLKEGYYWELENFLRKGENILNYKDERSKTE